MFLCDGTNRVDEGEDEMRGQDREATNVERIIK